MSMKLLQMISAWLYPDKCVLCGKLLQKQETDLCRSCRIDAPECPVNRSKYPYLNSWVALWYYEDMVRGSLLRYKFYGKRAYAGCYARLLSMKLLREEKLDVDVITWVPISQKRKRQRRAGEKRAKRHQRDREQHTDLGVVGAAENGQLYVVSVGKAHLFTLFHPRRWDRIFLPLPEGRYHPSAPSEPSNAGVRSDRSDPPSQNIGRPGVCYCTRSGEWS